MGPSEPTSLPDKEIDTVCPVCATAPTLKLRTTTARALCFCLRCGRTFEFPLDPAPGDGATPS